MAGVSLSRWTMGYFSAALLALLGAEILMIAGFGFPSQQVAAPQTLVLVHLVAIGWLSLLMFGALLQFVPVLVARPIAHTELPAAALAFLIAGLVSLIIGFVGMAGFGVGRMPWLPLGAMSLVVGFGLNLWNLGRTLWLARPIGLPARFVAAGLVSLVGVVGLGVIFAFTLGGWVTATVLADLTAQGVAFHAALGFGGWLTFTAMGVSYRLLAMFMLAPEVEGRTGRVALVSGAASIFILLIGGPVCLLFLGFEATVPLLAALALAAVSLVLYGYDIVRLYRTRRRRKIELNARMAVWALASLGLGCLLLIAVAAFGATDRRIGTVVFVIAFGWLTGLGLAKLYKIVAFLTWLECYGVLLGKRATPRVQDLVDEPRAIPWFRLYFVSVGIATIAAFLGAPLVFRIAAFGMLVATAKICVELASIRTLRLVTKAMLPEGDHVRPRLLLPRLQESRKVRRTA